MSILSVVNLQSLFGSSYRAMSVQTQIEYFEAAPEIAIDWLLQGRVDAALLPLSACQDAGLSVLPYGLLVEYPWQPLFFVSDRPADECTAVYVEEGTSLDLSLFRLLCATHPGILPAQCPVYHLPDIGGRLPQNAGLLTDTPYRNTGHPYTLDILQLYKETPAVRYAAYAWALKPDTDYFIVAARLSELLENALRVKEIHFRAWAETEQQDRVLFEHYTAGAISYAARTSLSTAHRRSTAVHTEPRRKVDDILARSSEGERISYQEACFLAEHASLGDLGSAASLANAQMDPAGTLPYTLTRCISCISYPSSSMSLHGRARPATKTRYLATRDELHLVAQDAVAQGFTAAVLVGDLAADIDLSYYSELCSWLKEHHSLKLYGVSTRQIAAFAGNDFSRMQHVLEQVHACGVHSLMEELDENARSSGQLLDKRRWGEMHRIAHALGMHSHCTMTLSVWDSWHERIRLAHRVRELQDDTGGVLSFSIAPGSAEPGTAISQEDAESQESQGTYASFGMAQQLLKTIALSRLFLNNVPFVRTPWQQSGPSLTQAALCFGANYLGPVVVSSSSSATLRAQIERHVITAGYRPREEEEQYSDQLATAQFFTGRFQPKTLRGEQAARHF